MPASSSSILVTAFQVELWNLIIDDHGGLLRMILAYPDGASFLTEILFFFFVSAPCYFQTLVSLARCLCRTITRSPLLFCMFSLLTRHDRIPQVLKRTHPLREHRFLQKLLRYHLRIELGFSPHKCLENLVGRFIYHLSKVGLDRVVVGCELEPHCKMLPLCNCMI
ncbi:uncharacterized protein EI90DRAFT_583574 [Cantharellus anzutake]|uniref:uncharacterized protein n=1 Tax=Cantharellus anzutake TaxID=1750568 RepID=UPI001908139D|nr:uncharacterized protein EI90DRAFT_583574 [Cantharellus anzutake]KAF8333588.1 hypothetical protein EI90DRAFT_583574 [Cantharellus anzutake]